MSREQIDFVFDWSQEDGRGEIVRVYRDPCLQDNKGNPYKRCYLIEHEIQSIGWDWFIGDDTLPSGRYRWRGTIIYSQDYWGEWDVDISSSSGYEPANRQTRRRQVPLKEETK